MRSLLLYLRACRPNKSVLFVHLSTILTGAILLWDMEEIKPSEHWQGVWKRVVVVGGGVAGSLVAKSLQFHADVTLIGIWAGMHTVQYFDGKTYEWVGISRQPNIMSKS